MEGYYDGTIFHRVIPEFMAQGGDPEGTGHGGESIYDKPFQDEFHSRLRFVRRGLVAMANEEVPNTNGSQFFFTLAASPDLNNKHTIFGRVAGDTVYNMIKLGEGETDRDARPVYPHKIIRTEILVNPFDDIVPRENTRKLKNLEESKEKKSQMKATKNFKLLSFGDEAEEDEVDLVKNIPEGVIQSKGKSSHDLLEDKNLSSEPAVDLRQDAIDEEMKRAEALKSVTESIRKKLNKNNSNNGVDDDNKQRKKHRKRKRNKADGSVDDNNELSEEHDGQTKITTEPKDLSWLKKVKPTVAPNDNTVKDSEEKTVDDDADKPKKKKPKNQSDREERTLALLAKFKSKLESAVEVEEKVDGDDDDDDAGWMTHTLRCEEHEKHAKDANVRELERYDATDPRNPLTQRRREASELAMKGKKSKKDIL